MEEIWKDIPNYEGIYQISNLGRLKSLRAFCSFTKKYFHKEKIVKGKLDKAGYVMVGLCKEGKTKYCRIHRLVAQAFIPNINNYPMVNHKDENKSNNNVNNLEWCTCLYNNTYGNKNKNISNPIIQYDLKGNYINDYKSISEASRQTGICHATIIYALKHTEGVTHNYKFIYK